ncbi:hypothetical protein OHT76_43295 [Streptomyces sp. NBC_00287]|uniref:hypothetical protein n=1 Tax=Streptomyces sp. NBC_00287 TaxID=2975702 RepID=UPI002E2D2007|nr:hypothetical protein [Streptomyces sp. NBC_00287]
MDNGLAHEESAFINFRRCVPDPKEHGFRWVDIKQLRFSAESVDDRGLLAALIGHEQFRDDYAGGGVLPDGHRHGPYWLRLITPDLYEPISQENAVQILREWVDPLWDVPTELEADLQQEVFARLEVLTEAVDHVTFGLDGRWSGRGKATVAALDRVG